MLLGKTFIDKHVLAGLPEEGKVTICDSSPVAIIERVNNPTNVVTNTTDTRKVTIKNFHESTNDAT